MSLDDWQQELEAGLAELRGKNRLRILETHTPGIDFCSNDYLALNESGRLYQMLQELLAEEPAITAVGSTGSRLIRGHDNAFTRAEEDFACLVGFPASLLFHSGYAANLGTIQALVHARDLVLCDRLCHASLLDAVRLSGARRQYFKHNDLADLERLLDSHYSQVKRDSRQRVFVLTESVFSMDGDTADLESLCALCLRYGALPMIDEAHAIGVVGPNGAGYVAQAGLQAQVAAAVYPCGKAPGLMGAFVAGSSALKSTLVNRARSFVFSTAQPPLLGRLLSLVLAEFRTDELGAARDRIAALSAALHDRLRAAGFDTGHARSHIVPVMLGSEERALAVAAAVRKAGMDERAIRPPTVPAGECRLRICVRASHTHDELEKLAQVICAAALPAD